MRKKTVSKLFEIKDLSIANKLPYTNSLNDDISSFLKLFMAKCNAEIFCKVPKRTIDWKVDENGDYNSSFELDLTFDSDAISRIKPTIIPGFQSCLIGRYYSVKLSFELERSKAAYITLPISVI
ncbi:unnamed protein product [Ambrosiozyma monospora]|uniref:Unnamed protein product n=1 Tax=Ambrosiozyma monospora TaxID=43982 RepID=A0A9W6YPA9_AMBMO|nr:unnamed protein product [Ambrosiozyma monospora]